MFESRFISQAAATKECLLLHTLDILMLHVFCGEVAPIRVSSTSRNPGKRFFGCKKYGDKRCGFFEWVDKEKTVNDEMQEVYRQMNTLAVAKEDLRAVVDGLKALNNNLMKKVESEKKKKEDLQLKFDQCKKELKFAQKRGFIVVFALLSYAIISWIK